MSLRWRLALVLAATVAVTVAFASLGSYIVTANELHDETDRFLRDRATQLVTQVNAQHRGGGGPAPGEYRGPGRGGPPPSRPTNDMDDVERLLNQPDALVQYVDVNNSSQGYANTTTDLDITSLDRDVAAGRTPAAFRDEDLDGTHYRVYTAPLSTGTALQIARDAGTADDVLAGLRVRMILLGASGAVVAAAIGWFIARHTMRPVEELTAATEQIAVTQQLAEPIAVDRHDEVGRLAESFNAMLVALTDAREQQQRLVQDASHELRTPLTSLRTNIEVLASADRLDPADRARLIDDVGSELVELTDLVNELVVLAQSSSPEDEPIADVPLDDAVRHAVHRAERRTGRTIAVDATPCFVQVRPSELDRVLTNLLSNATKFSPEGTAIDVRVDQGRVEVRDHGPGIDPKDQAHVFERFYRSDAARSAPGSGLGLSIVEQVVTACGGRVFVGDAPGGGAIVGFSLPFAAAPVS